MSISATGMVFDNILFQLLKLEHFKASIAAYLKTPTYLSWCQYLTMQTESNNNHHQQVTINMHKLSHFNWGKSLQIVKTSSQCSVPQIPVMHK